MGSVARWVSEEGPVFASPLGEDSEHAFVEALKRQDRRVQVRFYDRYADLVERIIARIVGVDDELSGRHLRTGKIRAARCHSHLQLRRPSQG